MKAHKAKKAVKTNTAEPTPVTEIEVVSEAIVEPAVIGTEAKRTTEISTIDTDEPKIRKIHFHKHFTPKRLLLVAFLAAILIALVAIPLGYILALQNNWFGLNEGTLAVKINVQGKDQSEFLDTIKLAVNGQQVELNPDLTYSKKLIAGSAKLEITGDYYTNQSADVTINRNSTTSYEFNLVPTATLSIKAKDFLSGEDLTDFSVRWNGKDYKAEGTTVLLQGLEPQNTANATLQISKDGFISKSRTVTGKLEQGLTEFHDNSLVQKGRFYYVSNTEGSYSIYSANYDGSDKKKLTDNKGNDHSPQYLAAENKVYFLSNRAGVKSQSGNVMDFVYSINPDGTGLQKITTGDYKQPGYIGEYSFYAKMRIFADYDQSIAGYHLFYGSIKGQSVAQAQTATTSYPSSTKISHHGKFLVYVIGDNDGTDKLYFYDIATKKNTLLMQSAKNEGLSVADISKDSKYLLVNVSDGNSNTDLWRVSLEGKKKLTNDLNAQSLGSFLPNSQQISYIVSLDEKPSLFTRDLNGGNERKWNGDERVGAYTWVSNEILLFKGEKGVYISKNAGTPRKVLDSVVDSTFEMTYEYYD